MAVPNTAVPRETDAGRVIALGFFDGVHLAHRALFEKTLSLAAERGLSPAVLTFSDDTGRMKADRERLTTEEERLALIRDCGIPEVILLPFSEVRDLTPDRFVSEVLKKRFSAAYAVCGYNFRFGAGASGDAQTLSSLMGGNCAVVPEILAGGVPVSTTAIKRALSAGDAPSAAEMLGHPFRITGEVVRGFARGRTVGVPTANLCFGENAFIPKSGVWAARVTVFGVSHPAVCNIGTRPTVVGEGINLEAHLIGFSGDLAGAEMAVELLGYIREERRFPSLDTLSLQIRKDITEAEEICKRNGRA